MRFCLAFGALSALTAALLCSVACKHNDAESAASSKSWQDRGRNAASTIERVKAEALRAMDAGSHRNATLEMIPYVVRFAMTR